MSKKKKKNANSSDRPRKAPRHNSGDSRTGRSNQSSHERNGANASRSDRYGQVRSGDLYQSRADERASAQRRSSNASQRSHSSDSQRRQSDSSRSYMEDSSQRRTSNGSHASRQMNHGSDGSPRRGYDSRASNARSVNNRDSVYPHSSHNGVRDADYSGGSRRTSNGSRGSQSRSRSSSDQRARNTSGANRQLNSSKSSFSRRGSAAAYRKQRSRRRRKKILLTVVIVVLSLLVVGAGVAFGYVHYLNTKLNNGIDSSFKSSLSDSSSQAGDPFYALLLGIDSDENRVSGDESAEYGANNFRSDSIILARVDPQNKQITLVSMHRDTMVDLSAYGGTGKDKLNAAYHYGGPQLVVKEVEQLAGVKISHYAEVNIDGLADITGTLGGVEVDVPMTFYDSELDGGLNAGVQTLDGDQALLFCRARHAYDNIGDGDVYRAKNQRIFISALINKVLSSDVSTMIQMINTTVNYIKTDMSVSDITSLAKQMQGMDTSTGIYSAMCPTTSDLEDGVYYEKINTAAFKNMMKRVDAGLSPTEDSGTPTPTPTLSASS